MRRLSEVKADQSSGNRWKVNEGHIDEASVAKEWQGEEVKHTKAERDGQGRGGQGREAWWPRGALRGGQSGGYIADGRERGGVEAHGE